MIQKQSHETTASPLIANAGVVYAVLAYSAWGLFPLYWKFFGALPAIEVLSHRVIWSLVFLVGLLVLRQQNAEVVRLLRSPHRIAFLLLTALLLSCNWGIYIYGVNTGRVVETSLGYFINPLISVLLGVVFLRERLNRVKQLAVVLATLGVINFVWQLGTVPWIALALAVSFALYGFLRKIIPVAPMVGLVTETLLIAPVALALIGYWAVRGVGHLGTSWSMTLLLIGAGVVTSLPLLWFNNAAKRLPLSTLGFLQYLAPSLQLTLGVFLYHERFTPAHSITFGLIWLALALYSTNSFSQRGKRPASV